MELMPSAKSRERSLERASEEQRTSYVQQKSNKLEEFYNMLLQKFSQVAQNCY